MTDINLSSPHGLGDALHVRAIALHHIAHGKSVTVYSSWPDIFSDLDVVIKPHDERRKNYTDTAVACFQCMVPFVRSVSQFRGVCLQAGVYDPIDLDICWKVRNEKLATSVKNDADGKPILIFQPIKADENEGRPNREAFAKCVNGIAGYFRVRLGHSRYVNDDRIACDLDLFDKLTVTDAIDVVTVCDLVVCEPSYLGILAQAFDKKLICMFASRSIRSENKRIAGVTPTKIFHKPNIATAIYDE